MKSSIILLILTNQLPLIMGESYGVEKKQLKGEQDTPTMALKISGALLHRMQLPIENMDFLTEVRGIMVITNFL